MTGDVNEGQNEKV